MPTTLSTAQKDCILTITLNRPDKLNALNATVIDELEAVLHTAIADPDCRALLLTGTGKAFCAGADIGELNALNAVNGAAFAARGQAVFNLLEQCGKPSIAAVNGYAFGGGCELAMAATLRLASEHAKFGQPEVKLGVIPGFGGTQRLPRLVGKGRALQLCLTGDTIDATTAHAWGLVNAIHPNDELISAATALLSSMIQLGPLALAATMRAIHHGSDMTLADGQAYEAREFGILCATDDKAEGVNAFLNKRPANFQNS